MQQTHHYTQPKNKHLHINSKQQHTVKLGASMMAATTTTSRSTKLKNFIWNKLASVRKQSTSSINLGPSVPISSPSGGQIDPQTDSSSSLSEKKQRRNIFHLFESSSKMKLNTGSSKKSATKSPKHSSVDSSPSKLSSPEKSPRKTPTPNLTDNNNLSINPATSTASSSPAKSIASTPSRVSSRGGGSGTELVTPEIESVKVNLIDNSMVKSKIHAASRRVNARKQPPTVSVATNNNGLLSSTSSNVNYSSFKNSLTELSCNSLNNNLRIIDMFGDDEPSLLLTQDGYTEKMDVSTTEKSSGIELKPIQLSTTSSSSSSSSSQRAGSRQHSQSQSGKFMMNTSRSIESSSSLTTNLLEINEDMHNVDLFSAGAHFGPPPHFNQSKSLFDCDHHESKENIFSHHVRSPMRKPINSNSNNMKSEEYIKLDPIEVINEEEGSTKNSNNIKKKLHSKTIIYDNNFTNHHYGTTASCQRQQKISTSSIDSSFYSSSQGTEFKSKSCERLNSATSNSQSPPTIPNPNQTAVESINSKIDYSKNNGQSSVDNNNFDCMNSNKKLNYSKSLKLVQQPLINNSNANNKPGWVPASNKLGGNLNDRTNIIGPNKQPPYVNNLKKFNETTNNEPSWKELAHRKHTAWSQKNLERKPSESQNNRPDTNKIDEKTEEVINQPTEGKVKSMISKFA